MQMKHVQYSFEFVESRNITVLFSEPSRRHRIAKTNKKICLSLAGAVWETRVQRMLSEDNIVFSMCVPILPQVESPGNRLFNQE